MGGRGGGRYGCALSVRRGVSKEGDCTIMPTAAVSRLPALNVASHLVSVLAVTLYTVKKG